MHLKWFLCRAYTHKYTYVVHCICIYRDAVYLSMELHAKLYSWIVSAVCYNPQPASTFINHFPSIKTWLHKLLQNLCQYIHAQLQYTLYWSTGDAETLSSNALHMFFNLVMIKKGTIHRNFSGVSNQNSSYLITGHSKSLNYKQLLGKTSEKPVLTCFQWHTFY